MRALSPKPHGNLPFASWEPRRAAHPSNSRFGPLPAEILGISAFYRDCAAAMFVDESLVTTVQEECFTRKKHGFRFAAQAINFCLREARLTAKDIDWVGFYDKPLLKFERLL